VYVSWSSSSTYGGDSGNRIFVLYWRCSLIRGSTVLEYSRITSPKFPPFCMTNFSASPYKPYGPSTPVTRWQLLHKLHNTGTSTTDCRNTMIYAHKISRSLPTCDVSLRSLTLPASEAGDLLELILQYNTCHDLSPVP
jgi:hypothetical protein